MRRLPGHRGGGVQHRGRRGWCFRSHGSRHSEPRGGPGSGGSAVQHAVIDIAISACVPERGAHRRPRGNGAWHLRARAEIRAVCARTFAGVPRAPPIDADCGGGAGHHGARRGTSRGGASVYYRRSRRESRSVNHLAARARRGGGIHELLRRGAGARGAGGGGGYVSAPPCAPRRAAAPRAAGRVPAAGQHVDCRRGELAAVPLRGRTSGRD
mmetsp:Transcript_11938/g.28953  ORF Transcript_11938/g.28953 Transcript_11938/m.28953 type:complete len:212 (+) Transcript_11938:410-1045(+)